MDYLREVGRRQQALLSRLLLGDSRREQAEEGAHTATDAAGNEVVWEQPETETAAHLFQNKLEGERERWQGEALEEQAEAFSTVRQADALWRGAPWQVRAPGTLIAAEDRTGAEALSRAVQRETRRYDGGFTMF